MTEATLGVGIPKGIEKSCLETARVVVNIVYFEMNGGLFVLGIIAGG